MLHKSHPQGTLLLLQLNSCCVFFCVFINNVYRVIIALCRHVFVLVVVQWGGVVGLKDEELQKP